MVAVVAFFWPVFAIPGQRGIFIGTAAFMALTSASAVGLVQSNRRLRARRVLGSIPLSILLVVTGVFGAVGLLLASVLVSD